MSPWERALDFPAIAACNRSSDVDACRPGGALRRGTGMNAAGAAAVESPAPEDSPLLRLEGVRKSFGTNLVLDGIDLEVAQGEVLVIIGPSGSGQSTLLRCVNLLEPIQEGRIFFEGQEI